MVLVNKIFGVEVNAIGATWFFLPLSSLGRERGVNFSENIEFFRLKNQTRWSQKMSLKVISHRQVRSWFEAIAHPRRFEIASRATKPAWYWQQKY